MHTILTLALLATTSLAIADTVPAAVEPTATAPTGKIIFYRRGSLNGAALGCPIRYKGEQLVELGRNKAFVWRVKPGRYILENKTSSVEVSVDPGETRYVRCAMKTGVLTYRADLQIVDGAEYDEIKNELEQPGE